jgi:hypothetical protein
VDNRSLKVFRQQKIAASTYQQIGFLKLSGYLLSLFYGTVFHKAATLGIDAKCVVL